jgi:hypothetical protein
VKRLLLVLMLLWGGSLHGDSRPVHVARRARSPRVTGPTLFWDPVVGAARYHVLSCPSNTCAFNYVEQDGAQWPVPADIREWILVGDYPKTKLSTSSGIYCGYSYTVQAIDSSGQPRPASYVVGCPIGGN